MMKKKTWIVASLILFAVWISLSGKFEVKFILYGGITSVVAGGIHACRCIHGGDYCGMRNLCVGYTQNDLILPFYGRNRKNIVQSILSIQYIK